MAEPERDHGDVGARFEQAHGAGVPQGVDGDLLGAQRRAGPARGREVQGETVLDGVVAEPGTGSGGEQRVVRCAGVLGEPAAQDLDGERGEWGGAFLAALAELCRAPVYAERLLLQWQDAFPDKGIQPSPA